MLRALGNRGIPGLDARRPLPLDEPGAGERTIEGDVTIEPRGEAQVVVDFGAAKK